MLAGRLALGSDQGFTTISSSPSSTTIYPVILSGGAGTLTLQLMAPIEVRLDPPAGAEDQVLWNGEPLPVDQGRPGIYRVNKLPAPESDRPQTAPLLP